MQKSATLTYDDAGNRTSQAVTQVSGTYNPTYNPQPAVSGLTTYTWDVQDRLASVTLPNGSVHRYAYDYRTRRISTGVRTPSSANETRTSIVFSGGLSVAEWEQESGTGLQPVLSAPPTVEYTRGPDMGGGVGGLLYSSRSTLNSQPSTLRYNLSNGRGDIVAQSDAYASLTWTASYEAYGKRTKETGENKDKQRGNSKDEDPTGLLNEGFRYRDIETSVWLSRDPAGFVDGPNLYAYVRQNPWTKFDPDGLFEVGVPGVSQPIHETITRAAFAASLGISNESDFKAAMRSNPSLGVAAMAAGKGSRHHDTGKFTSATANKIAAGYAADGKSGAAQAFMIERAVQVSISHYGDGQTNHGMSPPLIPYLAIQKYSAPELAAKIKGDLNNAFDSARKNLEKGNTFAAYTTMGEMAHTMQDAYSKSHIGRDSNGRVTEFFGYQSQDGPEHAKADHVPGAKFASRPFGWLVGLANVDDYNQIKGHPGVSDAMSATTSMFDAIQKGDKTAFNKLLDKTFDLAPGAKTGGHGGFVKKKK